MTYVKLIYDLRDGVASIRLNDPGSLNAMSTQMGEELLHAVRRGSEEARCITIGAEGRAFCSGANLAEGGLDLNDPNRDIGARLEQIYNPLILAIKTAPVPVITVVPGAAAGVGCGIAMAGDIILCGESGYFLQAFRRVGLAPDGGSSWLLSRAIGRVRAMEVMLLGERLPAAKALEWGLVTRVVPDDRLTEEAHVLAAELAQGPASLRIIKRLAWEAADANLDVALSLERLGQQEAGRSEDCVEGVTAFREKRPARFNGR